MNSKLKKTELHEINGARIPDCHDHLTQISHFPCQLSRCLNLITGNFVLMLRSTQCSIKNPLMKKAALRLIHTIMYPDMNDGSC